MTIPMDQGVLVTRVVDGGPADRAGLRGGTYTARFDDVDVALGGDIIVAVDGTAVTALQGLTVYLENKAQVGQTVQLTVSREGQEKIIPVVLGVRPQQ
jgi:2-alkenal reductase